MVKTSELKKDAGKDKMNEKPTAATKAQKDPKVEKEKSKKGKRKTDGANEPEETKAVKKEVKKKEASAKEIDIAQSKRLVKPISRKIKRTRKVVRSVQATIKPRDIGVEVIPPDESCHDPFCPFHGTLSVRGQIINGVVKSSKMNKTAIIQREIRRYIPKYERYEKRTHRYAVHNPPCLNVQRGDLVKIMECRPLSKSKSFVVIEKL